MEKLQPVETRQDSVKCSGYSQANPHTQWMTQFNFRSLVNSSKQLVESMNDFHKGYVAGQNNILVARFAWILYGFNFKHSLTDILNRPGLSYRNGNPVEYPEILRPTRLFLAFCLNRKLWLNRRVRILKVSKFLVRLFHHQQPSLLKENFQIACRLWKECSLPYKNCIHSLYITNKMAEGPDWDKVTYLRKKQPKSSQLRSQQASRVK